MKKLMLLVSLVAVMMIATPAHSSETAVRIFAHTKSQLDSSWSVVSHNFTADFSQNTNLYSFAGIRRSYGLGFTEACLGYTFFQGNDESLILSLRQLITHKQFSWWQDFEYYPKWNSLFTTNQLAVSSGKLDLGLESQTYTDDRQPSLSLGPKAVYHYSPQFEMGLSHHFRLIKFGGNFVRLDLVAWL